MTIPQIVAHMDLRCQLAAALAGDRWQYRANYEEWERMQRAGMRLMAKGTKYVERRVGR